MSFSHKRVLFYCDQYYPVRLGEGTYQYNRRIDNFGLLRAFAALTKAWLSSLRHSPARQAHQIIERPLLFYIETVNQRNAAKKLLHQLNSEEVLLVKNEALNQADLDVDKDLPQVHLNLARVYFAAVIYLPVAIRIGQLLRRKYRHKVAATHVYSNLAVFLAAVASWNRILKRYTPKSVVVMNDHNLFPLALLLASKRANCMSYYIQHASVSPVFPKLLADVALLEGSHAFDTYRSIGLLSKRVELVGIPRMDGHIGYHRRPLPSALRVGICTKLFYGQSLMRSLIEAVRKSGRTEKIVLRPHPGSTTSYLKELSLAYDLTISDSRKEDAATFLQSVDALISAESTILLEAALMRVGAIHFDDGSFFFPYDLYGYVRNEIVCDAVRTVAELGTAIDNLSDEKIEKSFGRCKYYDASIGSNRENDSTDLLVTYLRQSS